MDSKTRTLLTSLLSTLSQVTETLTGLLDDSQVLPKAKRTEPEHDLDRAAQQAAIDWNEKIAPLLSNSGRVFKLTTRRMQKARARLVEHPDLIEQVRKEVVESEFVRGGAWFNFDWILSETNLQKLLEGKYRKAGFGAHGSYWNGDRAASDFLPE